MPVELIIGPPVKEMSRTAAERALTQNPNFPKDADYAIAVHGGHYIAAFAVQSGPPFGAGAPADASEEAPGPKSEGPDDAEPSEGGESEGGESGSDAKPEGGEHKPGESKGGEHSELAQLKVTLDAIAQALGVPIPGTGALDGPVPGADAGLAGPMPPPPAPHPPGPPAPHGGPPGPGGPEAPQHMIHEKSGPPPVPTFSSTHPWAQTVGKVAHFRVAEQIADDADLGEVESELQALAAAGGFTVARFREERSEGRRVASAIVATPRQ